MKHLLFQTILNICRFNMLCLTHIHEYSNLNRNIIQNSLF